jgi:type I restriction enzyme M protein
MGTAETGLMAANGNGEGVKTRPQRRLTQAELDSFLEKAADLLRGGADHSEFRGYVFALLFYKRINDVYLENVAALGKELGDAELALDPRMHDFVVPDESLWSKVARKTERELGGALNDAMLAIERANAPKFDGILANSAVDFNAQDRLPRSKLVAIINHFGSLPLGRASVQDDLFGNAYEYLIRNFASKAGKSSGEFYTPREVAYLMSEIVEPQPGQHVCDWAAGSGGLLLQCRNYIERHFGKKEADRLFFYMQESNSSTANISRINMYLHGVRGFHQAPPSDSLRAPFFREGQTRRLRQFDRIVMNPPFSLQDWGYDDFSGGDPYDRFGSGMPPRDNGDYAWLLQVVKSLKTTGRAIVVMSQGVLFRGQPEQTEKEDGRKQKADAEQVIREAFIKSDLIECVVVLPTKLFYGNSIPGCLVILNKRKAVERQKRILLIWASRYCESSTPQNLLRRADCLRILVAWRAFGDLEKCKTLIPQSHGQLLNEINNERDSALADVREAYTPFLSSLPELRREAAEHEVFLVKNPPEEKEAKKTFRDDKKKSTERLKQLKRDIKALEKLEAEAEEKCAVIRLHAQREETLANDTAVDLSQICSDPESAKRFFVVAKQADIEENEFNLNVPRYVDTFEIEKEISIEDALARLNTATQHASDVLENLRKAMLEAVNAR